MAWHQKWLTLSRLNNNDATVVAHEAWCKALEIMITYDQLSAGALASAEFIGRQIQILEDKHRDKGTNADTQIETSLFAGARHRSGLCISPALAEWVAQEMRGEAAVMKERRKAREERALAKPKGGGG